MIAVSSAIALLLGSTSVLGAITPAPLLNERGKDNAPKVTVRNGSYYGSSLPNYAQDAFLGIPYAQPPTGDLRFRVPQSLNSTWVDARNATQYSRQCIGYGSDNWVLGNYVSEDCLTLNVVRPRGLSPEAKLPVAVWIHGGGFFMGGGSDPRYNVSFIVQESVAAQQPIIAVTLNYRLAEWGFLYGKEIQAAGASNLGIRDQRLALHWIQENIAAFGGDPSKVTIWGESAGAMSVAIHLYAYGGRDDGLFRAAISESGAASGSSGGNISTWQPVYDAVVNATNCTSAPDTLACLRTIPTAQLSAIFNSSVTSSARTWPVIDGDIITQSGTEALRKDAFVKVPYLIGTNFDEGTAFGRKGINTTDQFLETVKSNGFDDAEALTIAALYPDIPQIGIPATLKGRPPPNLVGFFGYQWKRSAAYNGDLTMQAPRRLTSHAWARNNVSSWSYHFDVVPNGVPPVIGATHFQEVAFVFYNIKGQGYENAVAVNPFANMPPTYPQLALMMSRFWISFISELNPNRCQATEVVWPEYNLDNPMNLVFDTNVSTLAYPEPDFYRAEGIAYLSKRLDKVRGF